MNSSSDQRTGVTVAGKTGRNSSLMFIGFALLVIAASRVFLTGLKSEFQHDAEGRLAAIADLKVRQVVGWRENLLSDARAIARNPFLADHLQEFLSGPTDSLAARFSKWLETERVHNQSRR